MPFTLVPNPISHDLTDACEDLVLGVREGHIVGLGVVVILKRNRFFVEALGELTRNPYAGRGMIASLDDCLREIGNKRRDSMTTM